MPLAKTGNKKVTVKVVVVAPSLTLTCRHINSPHCYCLFSLFGQFYKVASGDRWAVASERAIFLRHFHPFHSRSSILCGRSPCLKPPREAGWAPRRMMTAGSVRSTNRLPLSSICVDAFHFTAWQNSVYDYLTATRRCLITGAEEERMREDEREKEDDSG